MKLFEIKTQRGMDWFDIGKVMGVVVVVATIMAIGYALHG